MPISTFKLSSFPSPAFPLSCLLATTAGVFLPITHASNYLGMDLSSLKNIYYILNLIQVLMCTLSAFSWMRAPKTSRQVLRNCFVTMVLLNILSAVDFWYFIHNSIFASSSVHGVGRLNWGTLEVGMKIKQWYSVHMGLIRIDTVNFQIMPLKLMVLNRNLILGLYCSAPQLLLVVINFKVVS